MLCLLVIICTVTASKVSYTMYTNDSSLLKQDINHTDGDDIHFFVIQRYQRHEIKINDTVSLMKLDLDFNRTTVIIVHGWISSDDTQTALEGLNRAYVNGTNFNIIVVDWTKLAGATYKQAFTFVNTVSLLLVEFLKFLKENKFSFSKLHLIGHCLGVHIITFAGKYFKVDNYLVDSITALDPAYPLFKFKSQEELLDISDARYVQVIHTGSQNWGFHTSMGHVDFFPNGGNKQPGCLDTRGICDHNRALLYYAETIESKIPFTAIYCDTVEGVRCNTDKTLTLSGVHMNYGADGVYYILTRHEAPFTAGHPKHWKEVKKPVQIEQNSYYRL